MSEPATTASAIVSRKVRALMGEFELSQTELGQRIGMAQKTVSRRLAGERPWSVDEAVHVAQELDVPLERVLPLDELAARRAS